MSISEEWTALSTVLADAAPRTFATIRRPAGYEAVVAAERATAPWPDELREFFTLHDGENDVGGAGSILPTGRLLSVGEIPDCHAMMIEVMAEIVADDPDGYEESYEDLVSAAGTAGVDAEDHLFLPGYIPIAKWDSHYVFCDVRSGDLRGCVSHRGNEGDHMGMPQWKSLSHMIRAVRESVATGAALGWYEPRTLDGSLQWDIVT